VVFFSPVDRCGKRARIIDNQNRINQLQILGVAMKETLQKGLAFSHSYKVPNDKTVPYVFQESDLFQSMPPVFAMEALRPYMNEGEISLGTNICVTHTAATPPGMEVNVEVTLLEVNGPRTKWSIVARDEQDLIGEGTHERFSIDGEKFGGIVAKKAADSG
jgi:fluoroacetyl-CoA thioesterase